MHREEFPTEACLLGFAIETEGVKPSRFRY
jgi:hypothetical protein